MVDLHDPSSDEERIESPNQIRRYLEQLVTQRAFVSLRVTGGDQQVTLVLHVDADDDAVIIDAPASPEVDRLLKPGVEVQLASQLRGVGIKTSTKVRDRVQFAGEPAVRLDRPTVLRYLQRRARFRARIPMALRPTVELSEPGHDGPIAGQVVDMCAIGLGVEVILEPARIAHWASGDHVLHFKGLKLPEQTTTLSGSARVANVRPGARANHVGLSLVDVDDATEQALAAATLHYEREELRMR